MASMTLDKLVEPDLAARVGGGPWHVAGHLLRTGTGVGIAGLGLAFLLVAEHVPLFGFVESGYRPEVIVAIVADAAAMVFLSAFLFMPLASRAGIARPAGNPTDHTARARSG